ncbi:protein ENHANCED DISEASE RESISTANCE 4-like [Iris pallida]|uniref:Protein ENHANCED DISEASE RESISTANCE 4-like n=1 Tax=Iris pallida TaxID=29817 RepID=A0AAX6EIQ3_IRIPA|nr:protein ENHANCED DISEASE RESISTANCE 4-like [Iris pallida]
MASATVGVRFVRCPKCDKLLTEFHQVPVYRCGGCGTVLRAKIRASTAETTVRGSVETDSQSPAESSSSSSVNRSASPANQADTSLVVDNGMPKLEQPEPDLRVLTENLPERGNQDLPNSSLNEESSSYPCRVDNGAGCLEDGIRFTSLAYDDASDSSRDEQPLSRRRFGHKKASGTEGSTQPQTQGIPAEFPNEIRSLERDTTFGSDDFHSVQNWMGSEIGDDDLIALSKDLLLRGNVPTKASYSEPDHLKILRKVDELRDELREFLTKKTSEGKRGSHFISRPRDVCCRSDTPPRVPKVPTQSEKGATAKKHAAKRYFRPVCGGAPFVVCYKCWELLQLPADFLVSGKTMHKLRCGACSEVLVFSFRPRVPADPPRTPAEAQHPPSEVDHRDDDSSRGGPASQDVSRSSSYSTKRRNWQRANASRLHLLMGYSSASEILFEGDGRRHADGGNNSSETSTPQFYRPPPRPPRDDRRRRYGEQGGTGDSTSKSPEVQQEEAEESAAAAPRRRGSAALGLLKKGVRELSHGLESVKLKVQSRG